MKETKVEQDAYSKLLEAHSEVYEQWDECWIALQQLAAACDTLGMKEASQTINLVYRRLAAPMDKLDTAVGNVIRQAVADAERASNAQFKAVLETLLAKGNDESNQK